MSARPLDHDNLADFGTPLHRRVAMWVVLSVFAALLAYFGFRGYLHPELLFHFANGLGC